MKSKKGTSDKRQTEKAPAARGPGSRGVKRAAAEKKPAARPGARLRSTTGAPRIRASHSAAANDDGTERKRARPTRATGLRPVDDKPRRAAAATPAAARPPRSERKKQTIPPGEFREASQSARELAIDIAGAGLDKKALGVEVIDVSGRVDYADYLVIMTGSSDRHVHAISMGIEETLKKKRRAVPLSVEGRDTASWILIDFDDVVVHVFQEDTRKLYDIEGLWMDAGRLAVPKEAPQPAS